MNKPIAILLLLAALVPQVSQYAHADRILIESNYLRMQTRQKSMKYSGQVRVKTDAVTFESDELIIAKKLGNDKNIMLFQNVTITQGNENPNAPTKLAIYANTAKLEGGGLLTISGNVRVESKGNTLYAERITYDVTNGVLGATQIGDARVRVTLDFLDE